MSTPQLAGLLVAALLAPLVWGAGVAWVMRKLRPFGKRSSHLPPASTAHPPSDFWDYQI